MKNLDIIFTVNYTVYFYCFIAAQ